MNTATLALFVVQCLALVALVATPVALGQRLRAMSPAARREAVLFTAAFFALAWVVRWSAAPHTLIHENHHGYDYVATGGQPLSEAALFHQVPSAHRLLVALVNRALRGVRDPAFALDVTLSALGVPALFWLSALAFGRAAGIAAASLLLFQPLALFMAPTEEPLNLAVAAAPAGLALLYAGASSASVASLVAGGALVGLAATTRDVTLPLALLAPLAVLSAQRSPRLHRWAVPAAVAALAVALVPQLLTLLAERRAHAGSDALISLPHLPFPGEGQGTLRDRLLNRRWVGWVDPYIPLWMGAAMCASWFALAVHCARRRDLRLACVGLLVPLAAVLQGSLVAHGWFPSGLRHGLLSMSLCLLPVAWLYGALARRLPARAEAVAWLLAPSLCLVGAAFAGFADTVPLPIAAEYRFARDAVASMRRGDRFVELTSPDIRHVPGAWVSSVRPDLAVVRPEQLAAGEGRSSTAWLVTDRVCSLDRACFRNPVLCGAGGPRPAADALNEECEQALRAAPWRLVRSIRVCAPPPDWYPQPYDLPPPGRCATMGLYRWTPD